MDVYTVFGANSHQEIGTRLTRGSVVTLFGSTEIDLTRAQMASDEVILNVLILFGDTTVRVPAAWDISSSLVTIFGDATGRSVATGHAPQRLLIKGLCLFGSCDIQRVDSGADGSLAAAAPVD